jgi:hypothetical protein
LHHPDSGGASRRPAPAATSNVHDPPIASRLEACLNMNGLPWWVAMFVPLRPGPHRAIR